MPDLEAELQAAMSAMEASFHVELISTYKPKLICVAHDAPIDRWLKENSSDFDQFPVAHGDSIIGIVFRNDLRSHGTAEDAMYPLWEGVVVSSDLPIASLIPGFGGLKARLVLRGAAIDGLVTQSDLLKLPVRACVFSLLTHLEQVMADVVAAKWEGETWLKELSQGRQEKLAQKRTELQQRRMNPALLELTEFADKRDLCKTLVQGSKSKFKSELEELRDLRDKIAHASTFLDETRGQEGVNEFVNQFESAKKWIGHLSDLARSLKVGK